MDLLSILSADNYHDRFRPTQAQYKTADPFHSFQQLDLDYRTRCNPPFSGYVFEPTPRENGTVEHSSARTRSENKKRDLSAEPDQQPEPPKKKGRPSKAKTEDEDVALKRRSQLRTAQAAYRSRKDATIASLRTEVSMLEKTNEEMKALLSELHQDLIGRGLLAGDEWEFLSETNERKLEEVLEEKL